MLKLGDMTVSKQAITRKMRAFIDDYNFDDCYKARKPGKTNDNVQMLKSSVQQELIHLKLKENVCNKRHLNFVAALFADSAKKTEVNPYFMLRFDQSKQINDIVSFRHLDEGNSFIAVASNDAYIKIFSIDDLVLVAALKGIFGSPLCLDVSKDQSLLIAGYEDDTFIIYTTKLNFTPVCRGVGHHSFVSQVKFDNYLMDYMIQA